MTDALPAPIRAEVYKGVARRQEQKYIEAARECDRLRTRIGELETEIAALRGNPTMKGARNAR